MRFDTSLRPSVITLCVVAVALITVLLFGPSSGLLILGSLPLMFAAQKLGGFKHLPRDRIGLLYFSILVLTSIAPSIGMFGTLLRFGLAAVTLVMCFSLHRSDRRKIPHAAVVPLIFLVSVLVAAAVGSPSSGYGLARLMNWLMFIPLVILYIRKPSPAAVVTGFLVSGLIQMVGVGLQYLGVYGGTWGGLILSGDSYDPTASAWLTRYTGFLLDPNNLGLWLSIAGLSALFIIYASKTASARLFGIAFVGLFAFGIVLTGSRGALVALAAGILVFSLVLGRRGLTFALTFILIGTIVVTISSSEGLDRLFVSFGEIVSGSDSSATTRSLRWAEQLSQQENVFFGSGFGGYAAGAVASQDGIFVSADAARAATMDNGWLKLYLECGLTGVLAYGSFVLLSLRTALSKVKGDRLFTAFLLSSIVACLWRSLSIDILDLNPWNAVFFLLAAACFAECSPFIHTNAPPRVQSSSRTIGSAGSQRVNTWESA